jgi:hypothetical protein
MVMFMLHPILAADCFFSVETASFFTLSILLHLIAGLAANIFLSFGLLDIIFSILRGSLKRLTVLGKLSFAFHRAPFMFDRPQLPFWQTFCMRIQSLLFSFCLSVLNLDLFPTLLCLFQGLHSFDDFGPDHLLLWFKFFDVKQHPALNLLICPISQWRVDSISLLGSTLCNGHGFAPKQFSVVVFVLFS